MDISVMNGMIGINGYEKCNEDTLCQLIFHNQIGSSLLQQADHIILYTLPKYVIMHPIPR